MRRSKARESHALKKEVADILYGFCLGRARSMTSRQLAERLNMNPTIVRAMIAELRMAGQPIASSNRHPESYYIPATLEEANECMEHLRSRVKKICMAAAGVDKGLRARFGDQLRLGFEMKIGEQQTQKQFHFDDFRQPLGFETKT